MRRTWIAVLLTALMTFVLTENFALSHVSVRQQETGYLVSVFGVDTIVE